MALIRFSFALALTLITTPSFGEDLYKCSNHMDMGVEIQLLIDEESQEIFELWTDGMTLAQTTSWSDNFIVYVIPVADPENPSLVTGILSKQDLRLVTSVIAAHETQWEDINDTQAANSNLLYQCELS